MGGNVEPVLAITGLSKSFNGVPVLSDVGLTITPGEVHGLLGENGSGKSTLIKCLAGFYAPDSGGEVSMNGVAIELPVPAGVAHSLGLEFVHQDLGLIESLTVAENLCLEVIARPDRRFFEPLRALKREAHSALTRYEIDIDPGVTVADLRPVDRALVAIVRAMHGLSKRGSDDAAVLVLDEPTVFLPANEVELLFRLVRDIVKSGSSVLLVSHDLDEILRVTDSVTVLRNGHVVRTAETASVTKDDLIEAIIGRGLIQLSDKAHEELTEDPYVSVRALDTKTLSNVSFDLRIGEVFGLTGLVGSGYDEVLYALFGSEPAQSGTLSVGGRPINLRGLVPNWAIKSGIALVPGDRIHLGSVPSLSVAENMNMLVLSQHVKRARRLSKSSLDRNAARLMKQFDIRPPIPDLPYGSLSGGNQQKAMMAKWLQTGPKLVLLDEPTQGVDVGAREQVWQVIKAASAEAAVICASSDLEQLSLLCDRVGVVGGGQIGAVLGGEELTKENLAAMCLANGAAVRPKAAQPKSPRKARRNDDGKRRDATAR